MSDWNREDLQAAIDASDARTIGRPKKEKAPPTITTIKLQIPVDLLAEFDAWCKKNEYTRPQLMRHLMKQHLKEEK